MTTTERPAATWYENPTLTGRHVRLEPLGLHHAPGLLAAADADEVFQWLSIHRPRTLEETEAWLTNHLASQARQERVLWAQIDLASGEIAGTTSFYEVNPASRTVSIGYTWLGKRFWRTALNTEAKKLLLARAFDELGAVRVVWHTDERNSRSRAAIGRLGAEFEGLLRKHRPLRDGGWRTTAQFAMTDDDWPAARAHLTDRLASRT